MFQARSNGRLTSYFFGIVIVVILQLEGCASTETQQLELSDNPTSVDSLQEEQVELDESDPYEGFNRSMYSFNEAVDTYFADPVIGSYKWITPEILQTGISNVFSNMKEISVVLNDVLQGKLQQGAEDTGRFLINSTIGLGGLIDVADYFGLPRNDEDFGQTLAVWGVPKGPYLLLPFLGPATFRGVPGAVVDTISNPVTYLGWPVAVMAAIDKRATADESLKFIDEAAVDPYVFTRESYLQWRDYLATDGKVAANDDLIFDDELLFGDEEEDIGITESEESIITAKSDDIAPASADNKNAETAANPEPEQPASPTPSTETVENLPKSEEEIAFDDALKGFNSAKERYDEAAEKLETLRTKGSKYTHY